MLNTWYLVGIQSQLHNVSKDIHDLHSITSESAQQINAHAQSIDLEGLPIAAGAEFGSYMDQYDEECLPGTRTELLLDIQNWAASKQGKCIFWLNGLAGTGKSTISRTVAKAFQKQGLLGASFFFKGGVGDRGNASRFFPTITKQLLGRIPELSPAVLQLIRDNPEVSSRSLKEQFDGLIYRPLQSLKQPELRGLCLVIVVDALDECDNDHDIQVILQLLSRVQEFSSPCLRFFITSRPTLPIKLGFRTVDNDDLNLHEVPRSIAERDIGLFFNHKLAMIKKQRNVPLDWPGKIDIQALVAASGPSFIAAANICSELQNHKLKPVEYLTEILTRLNERPKSDEPPFPVLSQIFDKQTRPVEQQSATHGHDAGIGSLPWDQSDIESIFSDGTMLSSLSSQGEIVSIAISELAEILLNDNELKILYPTAISKVGPDRFQRNFTRILKKFGRNLEGEALNEIQRQAAQFVRSSAQQTAARMRQFLSQDGSKLGVEQSSDASKTAQVNAWLESQKVGHTKRQIEDYLEADVNQPFTDSDSDESEDLERASLSSIDEVKLFLLSTNAFLDLREDFENWIGVERADGANHPSKHVEGKPIVRKTRQVSDAQTVEG